MFDMDLTIVARQKLTRAAAMKAKWKRLNELQEMFNDVILYVI